MFDPAAWLQAARPLAQVNLIVPLCFGQAMAFAATGEFSLTTLYVTYVWSTALLLLIVFSNDYADREGDALNRTYNEFSGGSRVLPEGRLRPEELRGASWLALASLASASSVLALWAGRPWTPLFAVLAAALVWAYNFAPLRLSYRGHGEALQGLGTGVLLPLFGFYTQAGGLDGFPPLALVPMFLLGVVGNVATALPDTPADAAVGKRTYPVRRGQWAARRHGLELVVMAAAMSGWVIERAGLAALVLMAAPTLVLASMCVPLLGSAEAENRDECRRFLVLLAGAAHGLVIMWTLALVVVGLVRP